MEENKTVQEPVQLSQDEIIQVLAATLQERDAEIARLKEHPVYTKDPTFYIQQFIKEELINIKECIPHLRAQLKEYPEDKFLKIRLEQALHIKNFLEDKEVK